ncbi:MAG: response regulator [Chloroflexi bacterium]|nr:response regulator [Chloroflexota bacterium]
MTPDDARHLRHELRTPVNHLIGYADLLLDEDDLPAPLRTRLAGVKSLAQQVFTATAGVLDDDAQVSKRSVDTLDTLVSDLQDCMLLLSGEATAATASDIQRIATATTRLRALVDGLRSPHGAAPAKGEAGGASEAAEDAGVPAASNPGTILVVDDDEANREVLARRLARLGYGTVEARNGREAIETMAAQAVDLVLLDIMMPVMDGYAVLDHRRADPALRDIPVVMISALDQMDSVVRCIEAGAEDYLPKPFDPVLLQARITACLEKKRLHDAEKDLLATVSRQAAELRDWNRELETRVAEKVREVELLRKLEGFVAPQLAEVIINGGDEMLESHRREITVLFCDLRGFTSFAESAEPEDVSSVLRELHQAIGPLIFHYEGTVPYFTGDGLMVIFNDPLPCEEPAWKAVQLAVAMRDSSMGLSESWRRRGHQLELGIGVAIGHATCGRIGFEGRSEYTAIGTVTNLSARLCGEAKGGQVLVTERVYSLVEDRVSAALVGELEYKGLRRPVPTYTVDALRP